MAKRKKRSRGAPQEDAKKNPPPKSFVFAFGKQRSLLKDLQKDLRNVMQPFTAESMRVSRNNVMKDFVHIAGPLGVTHMVILTGTDKASYLRLCKSPRGPSATLKIKEYSLARDVQAALARPRCPPSAFQAPPLVVLNGFGGDQHLKLTGVLFQNMFPSLNVNATKVNQCQRVVLMSHNKATDTISLRHYTISLTPTGLTKGIKALVTGKAAPPDLSRFASVADFIEKAGYASDSDVEDAAKVGPRLELELVKIQEGLASGTVLYHRYEERSTDQIATQQDEVEERDRLRAERRRHQEQNVQKKVMEQKREKLAQQAKENKGGKAEKKQDAGAPALGQATRIGARDWVHEEAGRDTKRDDDRAYYEQEVGQAPDQDFGDGSKRRRTNDSKQNSAYKGKQGDNAGKGGGDSAGKRGGDSAGKRGRDNGGRDNAGKRGGDSAGKRGRDNGGRDNAGKRGGDDAGKRQKRN